MTNPGSRCRIPFSLVAALFLMSCAPESHFVWGSYESDLYSYYKDPERLESFMLALESAIVQGEEAANRRASGDESGPRRIAPGLYAEYGYLLLLRNEDAKAKSYFQKEKQTWPESTVLMDKMIAVVDRSQADGNRRGVLEGGSPAK